MDKTDKVKEKLEQLIKDTESSGETILEIITRPKVQITEDETGVEINEGYDFKVNGAIPQLADAIAKLAIELPKNGLGENSDTGFIVYINQFFDKLKNTK